MSINPDYLQKLRDRRAGCWQHIYREFEEVTASRDSVILSSGRRPFAAGRACDRRTQQSWKGPLPPFERMGFANRLRRVPSSGDRRDTVAGTPTVNPN